MSVQTVHIRPLRVLPPPRPVSYCGQGSGESVSAEHVIAHVLPNRHDCCALLYRRLCDRCLDAVGFGKAAERPLHQEVG